MKDTSKTVAQQKSILYKVTKVINHPDYVNAFLGNDIALWFLEELGNPGKRDPIIDYPLLPSLEDEMMGGVLTAVGFGQTKFNGEVSKTLKRLDTPIVPTNEARSFFEKILRKNVYLDDAKQICVASNQNNIQRSVLPGDSGFFS